MSARLGRRPRRPDENVRLYRPVDGNTDVSARRAGRKTRVARACALGGAIACGLFAPAIARAADPFGTAQIATEVNAAVAQATAMVPRAPAAAVAPVESAKTLEAATKSLEVATKQAAAIASSATAEAQRQTQSVVGVSAPAAKGHRRTTGHRARTAGRSSAPRSRLSPGSGLLPSTESDVAGPPDSPSAALTGRAQGTRAPASSASPKPTRPSVPERSPPLPLPPGPGAALSGQAGSHGPLMPLVLGALAAVLLMMAFEFLPRALPPKAFRKPRLIALTPWHPG